MNFIGTNRGKRRWNSWNNVKWNEHQIRMMMMMMEMTTKHTHHLIVYWNICIFTACKDCLSPSSHHTLNRIKSNEWISVLIGHHCLIVKKSYFYFLFLFFTIRVWLRPWRLVNHWGLACWHELIFYIFPYIWVICINVCFFLFFDVSFEQYLT